MGRYKELVVDFDTIRSLSSLFVLVAMVAAGIVDVCSELSSTGSQNAPRGSKAHPRHGAGLHCHLG